MWGKTPHHQYCLLEFGRILEYCKETHTFLAKTHKAQKRSAANLQRAFARFDGFLMVYIFIFGGMKTEKRKI